MIDCLRACTAEHWPALCGALAVLLPSLIVGLSRRRHLTPGWAGVAMRLLDRLSVVAHKDARHSFKLPGKASEPHE